MGPYNFAGGWNYARKYISFLDNWIAWTDWKLTTLEWYIMILLEFWKECYFWWQFHFVCITVIMVYGLTGARRLLGFIMCGGWISFQIVFLLIPEKRVQIFHFVDFQLFLSWITNSVSLGSSHLISFDCVCKWNISIIEFKFTDLWFCNFQEDL